MTEPLRGKLVLQSSKKGKESVKVRRIMFPTKKGMSPPMPFAEHQLAPSLKDNTDEIIEVDLELDGGLPARIRPVDEDWVAPAPPPPPPEKRGDARARGPGKPGKPGPNRDRGDRPGNKDRNRDGDRRKGGDRGTDRRTDAREDVRPRQGARPPDATPVAPLARAFHNPYNFVPALQPIAHGKDVDNPLAQGAPAGHDRYHQDLWSGRIGIALEMVTPLLILDTARSETQSNGHRVVDLRTDATGRPLLTPTSLKGALRAAFEAVTNSRLSVFQGHDTPLARRMDARTGLAMLPARVTDDGKGIELWLGTATPTPQTDRPQGPMYAAWLPRYRKGQGGTAPFAVRYPDTRLPRHGDHVTCWLQLFVRRDKRDSRRDFQYWRVVAIGRHGQEPPKEPSPAKGYGAHEPVPDQPLLLAQGHVCITNQSNERKHEERVFFVTDSASPELALPSPERMTALRKNWEQLIADYQRIHQDDVKARNRKHQRYDAYFKNDDGDQPALSRQTYIEKDRHLRPGTLCYALRNPETGDINGLYPVMISRDLADCPPDALLPDSLKPARLGRGRAHSDRFAQLSPADRVFGWASQKGDGGWRGQLRIGPIRCETPPDDAVHRFPDDMPLPLAILGSPKPQQARFYVARDKTGQPQDDDKAKDATGYAADKGLRGRKAYPYPGYLQRAGVDTAYWDPEAALTDNSPEGEAVPGSERPLYREYVRRGHVRDEQNRSIKAWVKPDTRFDTWIDVINLRPAELGGLLWLLSLGTGSDVGTAMAVHRLGAGKPLGFGSVGIRLTSLDLANGQGKKAEYEQLWPFEPIGSDIDTARADETTAANAALRFVEAFKKAVIDGYGDGSDGSFAEIPFIAAFLKAAHGFADDLPLHCPRKSAAPDPKGEGFHWFVENGRDRRPSFSLGPLADDPGLPFWPEAAKGSDRRPRQPRRSE